MKRLQTICAVMAMMAIVGAVHANVILVDDAVFGENSVIRDVSNQMDFLSLEFTTFFTYNEVLSELGTGGAFEGWSVASEADLLLLGNSADIVHGSADPAMLARAEELRDWFGNVRLSSTHEVARGLILDTTEVLGQTWQKAFTIGRQFNVDPWRVDFRISGYGPIYGDESTFLVRPATFTCYPDLPNPELIVTGTEDYIGSDGQEYTRYRLSVTNWYEFPDELFEAAPDLPACGLNTNASRTWTDIYQEDGIRLYGFCGACTSEYISNLLWFALPRGETPPDFVYITLTDRRCEITYTSNLASTILPELQAMLDFFDKSVAQGRLEGEGPGKSAGKRLNALRNMIETAGDLIEEGLLADACEQLQAAYKKTDGEPKPPDFVTGDAASELAILIQDLMTNIGCG